VDYCWATSVLSYHCGLDEDTDHHRYSDMLADLSAAGELTIPATSPPSNKREREDSDNEVQQSPSTSQTRDQQPQHPVSMASTPYPPISTTHADTPPHRISTHTGAEFASCPPTAPVSSLVPPAVLQAEVTPDTFSPPVHSARSNKVVSMLLPWPHSGSYFPLGGSSGLGRPAPAIELPTSVPVSTAASFGITTSLSGTAAFAKPSTMHGHGNGMMPLTTGPGAPPGMSMMLDSSGLYDFTASASTPPSVSASSSSSPHTGFRPSADFSAGDANEIFDMTGTEMEFGGYGVPPADKEAMMRHFAPLLLQDGQIGVDRDTMMMWSTMPSTYECDFSLSLSFSFFEFGLIEAHGRPQDWETYMSSMMGIANTNVVDPGVDVNVGRL
jgi:hypothetical protein